MEKAFGEAIEKAVTAAVNKAVPAAIKDDFDAAVDQAVNEKVKEIEQAMEKKYKRATRKAELEANLDAARYMVSERRRLIEDLPDYVHEPNWEFNKLIVGLGIKRDLDSTRIRYFEGQLLVIEKEDEEEKKKVNEKQVKSRFQVA